MKLLIPCFLLISVLGFSQETEKRGTIKIEKSNCVRLENNDSIYAFVDQMPEYRGGQDSLLLWFSKNLKYPKILVEESAKATVFASFIVLKDGSISDIKIFKANNSPFEIEALRLLNMMPDWIPGRCSGTLADVKINLPIKFGLK
ncbi:MAG: energy transducer TonB [Bacteroidota bacterium]|nr:energy transducer TonB [Bacteroidota bacterium]